MPEMPDPVVPQLDAEGEPLLDELGNIIPVLVTVPVRTTMSPGGSGTSRKHDIAVTDLPQPDSPTTPSVRLSWILKLTPSTARATPCEVRK